LVKASSGLLLINRLEILFLTKIPIWTQLNFQEPVTKLMNNLEQFHDWTLTTLIVIMILVTYIFFIITNRNYLNGLLKDRHELEIAWTIIPFVILISLAIPSLKILYYMDEVINPSLTIQAVGHQWYWTYNYFLANWQIFESIEFERRYTMSVPLNENLIHLLETDMRVVLPVFNNCRVLTSSEDVLHCWGVSSLGIKVDAVPGRINQLNFILSKPGIYYGNCMELCGAQHRFMPITIEGRRQWDFIDWLSF